VRGAAVPGEPARLYPTGRRTFARVIGSDLTQAPAIVRLARRAGCGSLDIVAGATPAERSLARLVREASDDSARIVAATDAVHAVRAPCAFVSVEQPPDAAPLMRALHRAHPALQLLGPASLLDPWLARALGAGTAAVTQLVSPVPRLADLPPAARRFAAAFRRTFGRAPGPYAFLGYDAMRGIIAAIRRAGPRRGDRNAVVAAFLGHPRPSVLGPAATKPDGDTTLAPWAQARIHHGRLVLEKRV
jgi:branched-chain amino acid transport system substrate-binding protein